MISYKGHTISAEFRGHGKPPEHVVRRSSPCGTFATALLGGFENVEAAKTAIDRSLAPVTATTVTDQQLRHARRGGEEKTACGRVGWPLRQAIEVRTDGEAEQFSRSGRRGAPCLACVASLRRSL